MASNDGVDQLPQLPATPPSPAEIYDEKKVLEKRLSSDSSLNHKVHKVEHGVYDDDDEVQYVNGEPVITSGWDVSRYLIDVRDDGDPALTFRSLFLGTVFAGLGAALCQVRRRPYNPLSAPGNFSPKSHAPYRSTSSSRSRCRCRPSSCCC